MNTILDLETATVNSIIERHLNRISQETVRLAETAPPSSISGKEDRAEDAGSAPFTAPCEEEKRDAVLGLYHLLTRYIDQLESPDHGGWTLEEDSAVRSAVS